MTNSRSSVIFLVFLSMIAAVSAQPVGVVADGAGGAGNITILAMSIARQTDHWQGVSGQVFFSTAPATPGANATGSFVNGTNINFTIACDNPLSASGFILFSNSSSQPTGLVAGNLTILDELTGFGSDSGSNTFISTSSFALPSGTISGVPTAFPFVNQTQQFTDFPEGYLNDANNNIVFVSEVEVDLLGYNESFFDFQTLLLAPNRQTIPYFIFADIDFECPAVAPPPGGGAGGGKGVCIIRWGCDPWGPCTAGGFQFRECFQRNCPNATERLKPPTMRVCQPILPREEFPVEISELDIITPGLLGNLSLHLFNDTAYILEPKMMEGALANHNDYSVEGISYKVTTPTIYTAFDNAHPWHMMFWTLQGGGWTDHGHADSKVLNWTVIPPAPLPRLNPNTLHPYELTVTPPVMQPRIVDIGIDAYAGPYRIKSTIAPLDVRIKPFQVAAEWLDLTDTLVLYFVVDNRGNKEKSINIEVGLNKGRNTLVAELLGPLRLPEDSVAIYGHEYRLTPAAMKADRVEARLIGTGKTRRASYSIEVS